MVVVELYGGRRRQDSKDISTKCRELNNHQDHSKANRYNAETPSRRVGSEAHRDIGSSTKRAKPVEVTLSVQARCLSNKQDSERRGYCVMLECGQGPTDSREW